MQPTDPARDDDAESIEYVGAEDRFDPLQKSRAESPKFTYSMFKEGHRLSTIQRLGYGILSSAYLCFGGFSFYVAVLDHHDGSRFFALGFGLASVALLLVGFKGIRNVLKFPSRANN